MRSFTRMKLGLLPRLRASGYLGGLVLLARLSKQLGCRKSGNVRVYIHIRSLTTGSARISLVTTSGTTVGSNLEVEVNTT